MRRPVMYWRWVLSLMWICVLLLFGEYTFRNQTLVGSVPICVILTIIFVVLKLLKKTQMEMGLVTLPYLVLARFSC